MKLLLSRVEIDRDEIRVTGSKIALERLAAKGASSSPSEVLSFAQEWRPQRDSNPRRRRERAVS
jgi:hypothetical protein